MNVIACIALALALGSSGNLPAQERCLFVVEITASRDGVPIESHELMSVSVTVEDGYRITTDPGGWIVTTRQPLLASELDCDDWELTASPF